MAQGPKKACLSSLSPAVTLVFGPVIVTSVIWWQETWGCGEKALTGHCSQLGEGDLSSSQARKMAVGGGSSWRP